MYVLGNSLAPHLCVYAWMEPNSSTRFDSPRRSRAINLNRVERKYWITSAAGMCLSFKRSKSNICFTRWTYTGNVLFRFRFVTLLKWRISFFFLYIKYAFLDWILRPKNNHSLIDNKTLNASSRQWESRRDEIYGIKVAPKRNQGCLRMLVWTHSRWAINFILIWLGCERQVNISQKSMQISTS